MHLIAISPIPRSRIWAWLQGGRPLFPFPFWHSHQLSVTFDARAGHITWRLYPPGVGQHHFLYWGLLLLAYGSNSVLLL